MGPHGGGRAQRIGVLGGSFDPVHSGHLHVARAAQRARDLERVVFVPARRAPHKPAAALASDADRLAMLELALRGEPSWEISTLELERPPPSFTIDTLRALPAALGLAPAARLFLLIGGDNLAGLVHWRDARELFERAEPLVVLRSGDEQRQLEGLRASLPPATYAALERGLVRAPLVPVSATRLREQLARGLDPGEQLPAGVLEYIRARGIYAASAPDR